MGALTSIKLREIYDTFKDVKIAKDGRLILNLPKKGMRYTKLMRLRQFVHNAYFIPIIYDESTQTFQWNHASTYKFLTLLYEYFEYYKKDEWDKIRQLRNNTKESKHIVYAAGAIEKSPDGGIGSRKLLKKYLAGTKIRIINPCDFKFNKKYKTLDEFSQHHTRRSNWNHMHTVVAGDILAVKESDVVVAYIDEYIGTGTHSECTLAVGLHKPVYGIIKEGIDISQYPWLMGTMTRVFNSHEEFKKFIK